MNYYNEFDPAAAAWLRELISEGLIPAGEVDERSITDVEADDLRGFTQCHFFAGFGGWSLALQLAGWPEDRPVWTGSCPCQSFSCAGKQRGFADERDLWPVFADLVRERRPEFVFGEQVENAIKHGWLDRVYADMEGEGYAVGAAVLGAHSVGAPHRRQRLYWGICRVNSDLLLDDPESLGRGVRNAENVGPSDREINPPSNAGVGGCGMAELQGDGWRERNENAFRRTETAGKSNRSSDSCDVRRISDTAGERCGEAGRNRDGCEKWASDDCEASGMGNAASDDKRWYSVLGTHGERREDRGSGDNVRMADCERTRLERHSGYGPSGNESGWNNTKSAGSASTSSDSSVFPWNDFRILFCRDGKIKRVPAESLLFGVADGVSGGVDGSGTVCISEDGGFPLTTQKEGRAMLLKGCGNAIVPQIAAEFVVAFMESLEDVGRN